MFPPRAASIVGLIQSECTGINVSKSWSVAKKCGGDLRQAISMASTRFEDAKDIVVDPFQDADDMFHGKTACSTSFSKRLVSNNALQNFDRLSDVVEICDAYSISDSCVPEEYEDELCRLAFASGRLNRRKKRITDFSNINLTSMKRAYMDSFSSLSNQRRLNGKMSMTASDLRLNLQMEIRRKYSKMTRNEECNAYESAIKAFSSR